MSKYLKIFACFFVLFSSEAIAKGTDKSGGKSTILSTEIEYTTDSMAYVEANVIATFYHEFGHALIDLLNLPVFAREEDAADSFSVVFTDVVFSEERAEQIAWASADQYLVLHHKYKIQEPTYWGVHSHDLVRYYNLLCIFYGGNVDLRDDFAEENGLPEERAETCEEEREMTERAWMSALDSIKRTENSSSSHEWIYINEVDEVDDEFVRAAHEVIRQAVKDLNERYAPKFTVRVDLTDCGEDNAFYEPDNRKIIMCNEYIPPLVRSAK